MTTIDALVKTTVKTKRNISLEISGSKGMSCLKVSSHGEHKAAEFYFYTDEIPALQTLVNEYLKAITSDNLVKGIELNEPKLE